MSPLSVEETVKLALVFRGQGIAFAKAGALSFERFSSLVEEELKK